MKFDLKIFEFLTLPLKTMTALAFASGILLFAPDTFLERLFMIEFMKNYGFYVGILFLISSVLCAVSWISILVNKLNEMWKKRKFLAAAKNNLMGLTDLQKAIVFDLFNEDNHTLEFPINDGAIVTLSHKKVITMIPGMTTVIDFKNIQMPYLLQIWVIDELNKSPNLLKEFEDAHSYQVQKIRG